MLKTRGRVEDSIRFGPRQKLIYTVKVSDGVEQIAACFNHPFIMILIPRNTATHWINSEDVGIRGSMNIPGDQPLDILVEKDFKCLVPREEDETALFPNPESR